MSTLLKLARLEMGAETIEREGVDIGTIVAEVLRSLAAIERERDLRLTNAVAVSPLVEGDSQVVRIIVSSQKQTDCAFQCREDLASPLCKLGVRYAIDDRHRGSVVDGVFDLG